MSSFRKIGGNVGKGAGFLIGEPIKFVGEMVGSEWIKDVGEGVKRASAYSFDVAGQAVDGLAHVTFGCIEEDSSKREQGWSDLKGSMGRTVNGIEHTLIQVAKDSGEIYRGIRDGDHSQLSSGFQGMTKKAAVAVLAVGVVDVFVDHDVQADDESPKMIEAQVTTTEILPEHHSVDLDTRNEDLAGTNHPETGVPFVEKSITLPDGDTINGVFPVFEADYALELPSYMYEWADQQQFDFANENLANAIAQDPHLAAGFTNEQIEQISIGETPDGYVWHHDEEMGRLELVDEQIHAQTGHTGGRIIWGGGAEHR